MNTIISPLLPKLGGDGGEDHRNHVYKHSWTFFLSREERVFQFKVKFSQLVSTLSLSEKIRKIEIQKLQGESYILKTKQQRNSLGTPSQFVQATRLSRKSRKAVVFLVLFSFLVRGGVDDE
jgi:hypothetical protein